MSSTKDLLGHASEDLDLFLVGWEQTRRRILEAVGGQPRAQSYDAPSVSGVPTGNPVHTAGERAAEGNDRAREDLDEITEIARRMARDADRLIRIATTYKPRPPTSLERTRTDGDNEPGCTSCARTFASRGVKRWVAVHRDGLCRFCYEWRRRHGGIPTVAVVEKHHRGERIRVRA